MTFDTNILLGSSEPAPTPVELLFEQMNAYGIEGALNLLNTYSALGWSLADETVWTEYLNRRWLSLHYRKGFTHSEWNSRPTPSVFVLQEIVKTAIMDLQFVPEDRCERLTYLLMQNSVVGPCIASHLTPLKHLKVVKKYREQYFDDRRTMLMSWKAPFWVVETNLFGPPRVFTPSFQDAATEVQHIVIRLGSDETLPDLKETGTLLELQNFNMYAYNKDIHTRRYGSVRALQRLTDVHYLKLQVEHLSACVSRLANATSDRRKGLRFLLESLISEDIEYTRQALTLLSDIGVKPLHHWPIDGEDLSEIVRERVIDVAVSSVYGDAPPDAEELYRWIREDLNIITSPHWWRLRASRGAPRGAIQSTNTGQRIQNETSTT